MHNRLMSNVGPFFFFFGFVSIFACGLRFSQQTLPCIFFAGLLFVINGSRLTQHLHLEGGRKNG